MNLHPSNKARGLADVSSPKEMGSKDIHTDAAAQPLHVGVTPAPSSLWPPVAQTWASGEGRVQDTELMFHRTQTQRYHLHLQEEWAGVHGETVQVGRRDRWGVQRVRLVPTERRDAFSTRTGRGGTSGRGWTWAAGVGRSGGSDTQEPCGSFYELGVKSSPASGEAGREDVCGLMEA